MAMAKDPAFLFYPGDWLGGTMGMSLEQKGAYMELLVLQFHRNKFKENIAINQVGEDNWNIIKEKFKTDGDLFWNERLLTEMEKRKKFVESRRNSLRTNTDDIVNIYLLFDSGTGNYKLGSSMRVTVRVAEQVRKNNAIALFYKSTDIKRKHEGILHNKFKNRKIRGDWFKLSDTDITKIKEYCENNCEKKHRTDSRTENENENENKNDNKNKRRIKKEDLLKNLDIEPEFIEIFLDWLEYKKERRESYKSSKSVSLAYNKLIKLSGGNKTKAKSIIEQSMANNWAGLWDLTNDGKNNIHPTNDRVDDVPIITMDD